MSRILLARHGNTFGPGDTPVWVGAKEDLPLVESGEAQARALGEALAEAGLTPSRIICGPLKRTRRAAGIVAELTGYSGSETIDERLKEIDYGSWGGKSNDEIIAEFGQEALDCWDKQHRRPPGADWSPSEAELEANALAAMTDAAAEDLTL
ncbi:MAG: histidine phosphatase family protein, partial [Alphaproteobacteria bacterium]|nr:histidine phosphatase family protein [Alphaproteobacteria bacterium]